MPKPNSAAIQKNILYCALNSKPVEESDLSTWIFSINTSKNNPTKVKNSVNEMVLLNHIEQYGSFCFLKNDYPMP